MLFYPQLKTGAATALPFSKRIILPTQLFENRWIPHRLSDIRRRRALWTLTYKNLQTEEALALEEFVREAEGRKNRFCFLAPGENLLLNSEDLNAPAWVCDEGFNVIPSSEPGPVSNASFRIAAGGSLPKALYQALPASSSYTMVFSLYLRSVQGTQLAIFQRQGGATRVRSLHVGPQWQRGFVVAAFPEQSSSTSREVGILLEPGAEAEIAGPQMEIQVSPSTYLPTGTTCGVYTQARLAQDTLVIQCDGPDAFSASVQVLAPISI